MASKPKFNPSIFRTKLTQEQAVLACSCYSAGYQYIAVNSYHAGSSSGYCQSKLAGSVILCNGGGKYTPGARLAVSVTSS